MRHSLGAAQRCRLLGLIKFVLLLGIFAGDAWAVETRTFGMEPSPAVIDGKHRQAFDYELGPRDKRRDAVKVFNKTRKPLTLAVYPVNATRKPDGSIGVGLQQGRRGPATWIRMDREEVRLPPKQAAKVGFVVQAPESFPEKKQYLAAIAVEPAHDRAKHGVAVVQRLATVVYVEPTSALDEIASNPLFWIALILLLVVGIFLARVRRRASS